MRRLPSGLLLAALALSTIAFAPAPQSTSTATAQAEAQQIVVCVKFREWTVPVVGYTWEPEYERFCVQAPDVNPDLLPISASGP